MKRYLFHYPCLSLLAVIHTAAFAAPNVRSLPAGNLHFIENKGQITDQHNNPRPDIDFKIAAGNGLNVFIGPGQIHYQWSRAIQNGEPQTAQRADAMVTTAMYRMDVTLLNANPNASVAAAAPQAYYERYYLPACGPDGATARAYRKIVYREVYPHIDWVFSINASGRVEHDFIVRPGGKVSDIRLQYAGATELRLNGDGSVTAVTPFGSVKENAPYCFQQDGQQVQGRFLLQNNILSFVTAAYQGALTIDPVLEWGTYFGGSEVDRAEGITTDKYGNVYITGRTNSLANIATTGAFQDSFAGGSQITGAEAFLAKFGREGDCRWATYYGGERVDVAQGIACDTAGNVYIAGYTNSNTGIATSGTHQPAKAGTATSYDAFLAKFDTSGQRAWGTYFGGTGADGNTTVAVTCDRYDNIYLTGNTQSAAGIATANGYKTVRPGGHDMFLAKFTSSGIVDWSTYYGGSGNDYGSCVGADSSGNVFVAGYTQSAADIALPGAHRAALSGARDVFLVKFDSGGQPVWATYYGGDQDDYPLGLVTDRNGNIIIAGGTYSDTGIATPGSHQAAITEQVYGEGFCAKFSGGGALLWGTYYGGDNADALYGVATGADGAIYLGGSSRSQSGLTTPDGYQPQMAGTTPGIASGLIVKLSAGGQRIWGTYYGGMDHDEIYGIATDDRSNLYLAGITQSGSHIATANGYRPAYIGGDEDGFLVRFNDCAPPPAPDTITGPILVCNGREAAFAAAGAPGAVSYTWILPAGWAGHATSDTIAVTPSGAGGQLRVTAHSACGGTSDTVSLQVSVSPLPVVTPSGQAAICAGDTLLLDAVTTIPAAYAWLRDGVPVPGATGASYPVYAAGAYRVVTDNGTCTDTSLAAEVAVHPLPAPVIVNNNGILATTLPYTGYQWHYGGAAITGATNPTFTATAEGDYTVTVTDTNTCSATSAPVTIGDNLVSVLSGREPLISLYPNPAKERLIIKSPAAAILNVYTTDGRCIIRDLPVTAGTMRLDLSSWHAGLYWLRIGDSEGNILLHEKLLKQ
jgi:hypothetical protein